MIFAQKFEHFAAWPLYALILSVSAVMLLMIITLIIF